MKRLVALLLAVSAAPLAIAQDDGGSGSGAGQDTMLPFMKDIAGDHELPRPYGIGGDVFTMHQDYKIDSLAFTLPGFSLADPSVIKVKNHIVEEDFKADAWLFPFLDVFAVFGHVDGQTDVDLSAVSIPMLPVPLGTLPIKYNGSVYGGGVVLAAGGDHWFASLTGTWTRSNLNGDFDSKVKARSLQPRIGLVSGPWQAWVGGMDLHTDETHSGTIALPGLGSIPFEVKLKESASWNTTVGVRYELDRFADVTLEVGGGDRRTTLLNVNLRFPRDK